MVVVLKIYTLLAFVLLAQFLRRKGNGSTDVQIFTVYKRKKNYMVT